MFMKKALACSAALAACLTMAPEGAAARRMSAAAAVPTVTQDCLQFLPFPGGVGAISGCGQAIQIAVPIVWDTTTGLSRSITFRGKRNTGAGLVSCTAFNFNSDGTVDSQSATVAVTAVGSYQARTLTLTDVPTGSQGVVLCSVGANGDGMLMGLEYTQ